MIPTVSEFFRKLLYDAGANASAMTFMCLLMRHPDIRQIPSFYL